MSSPGTILGNPNTGTGLGNPSGGWTSGVPEETIVCLGVECCDPIFSDCLLPPPISIDSTLLPCESLCVGESYVASFVGLGGVPPYTYFVSAGSLPQGLSLDTATGQITGTVTTPCFFTFTLRVTDSEGNFAEATYTLGVLQITTTTLPDYTVGAAYSFQLEATGGNGTYVWIIADGALPYGLTVSSGGLISGTPTAESVDNTLTFSVHDTSCL